MYKKFISLAAVGAVALSVIPINIAAASASSLSNNDSKNVSSSFSSNKRVVTAPVVRDDRATTPFGKSIMVDVLANDTITTTGATWKSVTLKNEDIQGYVANAAGGYRIDFHSKKVWFTPKAGYSGVAPAVEYVATDSNGKTATGRVIVTVSPKVSLAPTTVADSVATVTNKRVSFKPLANDKLNEPNSTWSKLELRGMDANGTLKVNEGSFFVNKANFEVSFSPANNWDGVVPTKTYVATDSNGKTALGTITVTVKATTAPKAVTDVVTTKVNKALKINVLANDKATQAGATIVSVKLDRANSNGWVNTNQGSYQLNSDKTITFTPLKGFVGKASKVTYTITDSNGKTANSSIDVTVIK